MSDGHYRYSAASDQTPIWVTSQALMAVEREAFPVEPVPRASQPGRAADAGRAAAGGGTGGGAAWLVRRQRRAGPDAGDGARPGLGD